jgi:hypothetical protein
MPSPDLFNGVFSTSYICILEWQSDCKLRHWEDVDRSGRDPRYGTVPSFV